MAKIIGNTTAMPNPRPDWNQTDEAKSDFIKNKPDIEKIITQALSGASGGNGIKHIQETVELHSLDFGMYIIDYEYGGEVSFDDDSKLVDVVGENNIYTGVVFVMPDFTFSPTDKKVTIFTRDSMEWKPLIIDTYVQEDANIIDDMTTIYVSKDYVDEQIATIPAEPSDWNENNPESPAYIKNRTHYKEEAEVDYFICEDKDNTGKNITINKIGLNVGDTYVCDIYFKDMLLFTEECTVSVTEDHAVLFDSNGKFFIMDGVEEKNGKMEDGNFAVYQFPYGYATKAVIHGIKGTDVITHKLSNEFIDYENCTRHYITEFNIAELNGKEAGFFDADFYPFQFTFNRSPDMISILFHFAPIVENTETGQLIKIFSNSPSDPQNISSTRFLLEAGEEKMYITLEEVKDLFSEAVPDGVTYEVDCGSIGHTYQPYRLHHRTERIEVRAVSEILDGIEEEFGPLFDYFSKAEIRFTDFEIKKQDGVLLYE